MMAKIVGLLVLQLIAILTFSAGFFPQKSVLKGDAEFLYHPEAHQHITPRFEKLVLVVIDALRADYLFQDEMSQFRFVHELLNKGNAWGYTAYSNPPTVTLPRLKGIATGSTPNFLDAILNVAGDDSSSSLEDQDSWLRQFRVREQTINFFGDDTWLKLFPRHFFNEVDGTSSFFVSDFEEVDYNVSRHLPQQLASQNTWDVMILHYLGLDHIGHKGGAFSTFMRPKHREMDSVIEQIYSSVDEDTLICVMGDHGMNDIGNHGGSSAGETSSGMVFISKKLENYDKPAAQQHEKLPIETKSEDYKYLTRVNQIDLVPTLATLFNFPIPKNSIGVLIPDFLRLFSPHEALVKLKDNYQQILSAAGQQHKQLDGVKAHIEHMRDLQEDLAKTATNYNYKLLSIGFVLLFLVTLKVGALSNKELNSSIALHLLVAVSLLLSFSTFGSSFVEEEHQLWWWSSVGLVGLSFVKAPRRAVSIFLILAGLRFIRGWNNSGQKYIYEHTMSEILKRHYHWQWVLNAVTILAVPLGRRNQTLRSNLTGFSLSAVCLVYKAAWNVVNGEQVPAWLQKVLLEILPDAAKSADPIEALKTQLVPMARLFFGAALGLVLLELLLHRLNRQSDGLLEKIHSTITTILIFQTSSTNIPQFLVFQIIAPLIESLWRRLWGSNVTALMTIGLVLQHLTFFQFGSTNSIATVNLTNAYNGVSENYNIHVVGFLMCVGNFAPAIYWSTACLKILYTRKPQYNKWQLFAASRLPALLFYCIFGCFLLGSCVIQRYHLFIWSVFSPKLCYYVSWNLFMHAVVGWVLEGLVVVLS
ncbi:LAME_0F18558g1_1 [Lachancea meyersii CBS 8951]|uniref:GPI ethanolamine phosphate transferase 2 n=1 Tax=Lachancea meyersii CBS 8951 TaxID=1266667 RepID=A0A1G4K0Q5_9SACH|nr:LAME_0F18558g1_1 [Lachancea meyersii CBS 8951]